MIAGARHRMFDHAPQEYSRIVLEFSALVTYFPAPPITGRLTQEL
jgi:hypothetical protein